MEISKCPKISKWLGSRIEYDYEGNSEIIQQQQKQFCFNTWKLWNVVQTSDAGSGESIDIVFEGLAPFARFCKTLLLKRQSSHRNWLEVMLFAS